MKSGSYHALPTGSQDEKTTGSAPDDADLRMGFLDHLEELRWTLIKSLAAFLIAFVAIAMFLKQVAGFLNWPIRRATEGLETFTGLVTTSPMAVFSVFLQICFLGGITLSLPFLLYFVGRFVAPALTEKEARLLIPSCLAALILFLAGSTFSYLFLLPNAIKVSIFFNQMLGYELIWAADRYYSLLLWMVVGMGAAFQFPMVLFILAYLRIVDAAKLRSWRPLMLVVFLVIAALITPPEPITQLMVALPLLLLYELSILLCARIRPRGEAVEDTDNDEEEGFDR